MTETTVDLRNIGRPAIESKIYLGKARIQINYTCELQYKQGDEEAYLLDVAEVEDFIWHFLQEEYDVTDSSHYAHESLQYTIKIDFGDDACFIAEAVKRRIDHILSCISWDLCPVCHSVKFKFINPDDLDVIWEQQEWNCMGGCDDDTRAAAYRLRLREKNGKIEQTEVELRLIGLELFVTELEHDLTMTLPVSDLIDYYDSSNLYVPEELREALGKGN